VIEIVDYRASWPREFREIAQAIRSGLGDLALRIDHIGSTSVPGLCAKDVIDIQISVARLDAAVVAALRAIGYSLAHDIPAIIVRRTTTARTKTGRSCTSGRRPASGQRTRTFACSAVPTNVTRCCFATISSRIRTPRLHMAN